MRMPPQAMIRTAATAQGVPGIWPWRSDAPDWPARDPHISLATRTRIWMSPCHPPLCRHPLTWPQGAQRVTKVIPSCIYYYSIWCALSVVYIYRITIAYVYRISSELVSVSLPRFLFFFWALSLCVCAAPPTRVCSTYIWEIILFLIFVISFLWVSFSFLFYEFPLRAASHVLHVSFSFMLHSTHTNSSYLIIFIFWFRFEFF